MTQVLPTTYEHGKQYEGMAIMLLKQLGFDAQVANGSDIHSHDISIGNTRIEIKGSQFRDLGQRRRGYQFLLYRAGKSEHSESDVTLLLCIKNDYLYGTFVIPTSELQSRQGKQLHCITIPSELPKRYCGRWKAYYECFSILGESGVK